MLEEAVKGLTAVAGMLASLFAALFVFFRLHGNVNAWETDIAIPLLGVVFLLGLVLVQGAMRQDRCTQPQKPQK